MFLAEQLVGVNKCTVNGKNASYSYADPYKNFKIHVNATVHQHHQLQKKLDGVLHDPPEHELMITLPSRVRIEASVCSTFLLLAFKLLRDLRYGIVCLHIVLF